MMQGTHFTIRSFVGWFNYTCCSFKLVHEAFHFIHFLALCRKPARLCASRTTLYDIVPYNRKAFSTFYPRVVRSFHVLYPKDSVYCWLSFMSLGVFPAIRHTFVFSNLPVSFQPKQPVKWNWIWNFNRCIRRSSKRFQ